MANDDSTQLRFELAVHYDSEGRQVLRWTVEHQTGREVLEVLGDGQLELTLAAAVNAITQHVYKRATAKRPRLELVKC